MLQVIDKVLGMMPDILKIPLSEWKTERIDTLPTLDRVFKTISVEGELFDIFLHKGYWKDTDAIVQPHTHACDSVMYIAQGQYELTLGYGKTLKEYRRISRLILNAGDKYEMVDPYLWHYFKPLSDYTLTIMVAGRVYGVSQPGIPGQYSADLSEGDAQDVLNLFKKAFNNV